MGRRPISYHYKRLPGLQSVVEGRLPDAVAYRKDVADGF